MRTFAAALLLALLAFAPGCKQGEGDRCQIDDDCEDSLVCGAGEGGVRVCRPPGTVSTIDAPPAPNADAAGPVIDGGAVDAPVTPDAEGADAAPVSDAGTPDA